jgi:hypothetical protein
MKKFFAWFNTDGKQTSNAFDVITLKKILKGALISACGAGSIYALSIFGALEIQDPGLASLVAFIVPSLINLIKEYVKGSV